MFGLQWFQLAAEYWDGKIELLPGARQPPSQFRWSRFLRPATLSNSHGFALTLCSQWSTWDRECFCFGRGSCSISHFDRSLDVTWKSLAFYDCNLHFRKTFTGSCLNDCRFVFGWGWIWRHTLNMFKEVRGSLQCPRTTAMHVTSHDLFGRWFRSIFGIACMMISGVQDKQGDNADTTAYPHCINTIIFSCIHTCIYRCMHLSFCTSEMTSCYQSTYMAMGTCMSTLHIKAYMTHCISLCATKFTRLPVQVFSTFQWPNVYIIYNYCVCVCSRMHCDHNACRPARWCECWGCSVLTGEGVPRCKVWDMRHAKHERSWPSNLAL